MELRLVTHEELNAAMDQIKKGISDILELHQSKLPAQTEFISRKDAAKLVGVTPTALDGWTKRGLLERYKIGGRIRYDRNEVISAVKNQGK